MTDRAQLMSQVWACVEQAFAAGDLDRARGLEHFFSALEQLSEDDEPQLVLGDPAAELRA
jgi:hypothetical protein